MRDTRWMLMIAALAGACSGGAEGSAPVAQPSAPPVAPVAPAAAADPPPAAAPVVTIASCTYPFGWCDEWAGTQWTGEANARSACRGDFTLGAGCTREGLVGTCSLRSHVTYYYSPAGESSCRRQPGGGGVWVAQ
jgi:hypothetical protein